MGAAADLATRCPIAVNTGSVGSCMFGKCAASRGPTHCTMGTCFCEPGFCRYPQGRFGVHVQSRYCVARIPYATCHLTRFCWSGGLQNSFCERGLCMCKWGLHPEKQLNGKYECKLGFYRKHKSTAYWNKHDDDDDDYLYMDLLGANAMTEEIQSMKELQSEQTRAVSFNILIGALWGGAIFAVAIACVAFVVKKYLRGSVGEMQYKELLG